MSECSQLLRRSFSNRQEALEYLKKCESEARPHQLWTKDGRNYVEPFSSSESCKDQAEFIGWGNDNESEARACATSLKRITGKDYGAVLSQANFVRSNFWKVEKVK